MSDWRGFIFLAIGIGVPLVLLLLRQERALLAWVCLSVGINIFDARVGLNFASARIVGMMVLPFIPFGAFGLTELTRTAPARILVAQVAYLTVLGVIFGYLYPWSDFGFIRDWSQTAQGRTLVYMARTAADLGIVLFVARQIMNGMRPDELVRLLLIGTTIAALGGVAEFVTKIQLYQVLTGYPIQEVANRVRGLNYEPRGLGLAMTHGFLFAVLWYTMRRSWLLVGLAVLYLAVLLLTVSASAVIALLAAGFALVILEPRVRVPALSLAAIGAAAVVALLLWGQYLPVGASWTSNLHDRFSLDAVAALSPENTLDLLTMFLDIFDRAAVSALRAYPLAAVIGAGPGLIMLPAGQFIPQSPRWSWVGASGEGITSLPSMGIFLEWANGGVVGVLLWMAFVWVGLRTFGVLMREEDGEQWRLARGIFVAGASIYLVQVSPLSTHWQILMGLAIGAAAVAARRKAAA